MKRVLVGIAAAAAVVLAGGTAAAQDAATVTLLHGIPGATVDVAVDGVLAAHVTWNNTIGPFFMLRDLDPGALIDVALEDGTQRTYQVTERTIYDKDELPRSRIWRTTGDESLVLITCGGSFNPDINRYRENIVVYAVPIDATVAVDGT